MKHKCLCVLSIALLATSCGTPASSSSESSEPALSYETKTVQVHYTKSEFDTTCSLRFYDGSVIPYVSIRDINRLLYRGRTFPTGRDRFEIAQNGDVYTITVAGGYSAEFDVKANKMTSSDLWGFKGTNLNGVGEKYNVSYDGMPFTRVKSVVADKPSVTTTIDFSKYDLRIYGDTDAVYVPLTFATDLFSNENILQAAYNNKDLFVFNYTENESLDGFGGLYYEPIFANPISPEYAKYVYDELCLDYDIFLGRPGRSSLEVYYDLSNGLDAALSSRPLGRTIAEYMKSADLAKFLVGSTLLGLLRNDGGHSGYSPTSVGYIDPSTGQAKLPDWLSVDIQTEVQRLWNVEMKKGYEEILNYDAPFRHRDQVQKARSEKLGKRNAALAGEETYTKDGDIAYIHIDGFMGEIGLQDEWKKYYRGERNDIPFGATTGGAVGAISYGVKQIMQDKEIKHLVVDLASNSGGSTDEMLFMIALLTGSQNFYEQNTLSGRSITATYEFDLNFDRVFDEKDEAMTRALEGVDITVLTTKNGFSCGGISPIYLHDEGLFTVGEECGGGSCSVYMQYDGYGNLNRSSSPVRTATKNGVSVDVARKTVCDHKLEFPIEDETYDYSSLYDTATLRALIEEHYAA